MVTMPEGGDIDDKGKKLQTLRNHPAMNRFIIELGTSIFNLTCIYKSILHVFSYQSSFTGIAWGSNTDSTEIIDHSQVSRYLSKYINKDEPHSATYTKASKAVVAKVNEDSTCKNTLQKVMMAGMPRDVPRQVGIK